MKVWTALRSGAAAGAISAFAFAAVHDLFISDIWFSVIFMMLAGAICGALVAWSYALLANRASLGGWLVYNSLYVLLFAVLGAASVLAYEPVTTLAAVLQTNGPPDELFGQAMPLTALFTLSAAVLVTALYGWGWRRFAAVLLTCIPLVLFLGLNVSAIGLVDIPRSALYLIVEMFGLILAIDAVYALVFIVLERRELLSGRD